MVSLADHLSTRTEAILSAWRAVCDIDPLLPTASILTDEEFRDNVPNFLKALSYPAAPGNLAGRTHAHCPRIRSATPV